MIASSRDDIEFIVCDNCSEDDTFEVLKSIIDKRVKVFRNDTNLGVSNTLLLQKYACGKYTVNVNDRDYIKPQNIDYLCDFLNNNPVSDFLFTNGPRFTGQGKCSYRKICDCYFFSEHPGYFILNHDFYLKHIKIEMVEGMIRRGDIKGLNPYVMFSLLLNANDCIYKKPTVIEQPEYLGDLKTTRKETFGSLYILPEFHKNWFLSSSSFQVDKNLKKRKNKILISQFRMSLLKVTAEYRKSLRRAGFRERYNCGNLSIGDYRKNSIDLIKYVLSDGYVKSNHLGAKIILTFIFSSFYDIIRLMKEKVYG